MHLLEPRIYRYIAKIKNMLDVAKPNSLRFDQLTNKKIRSPNNTLKYLLLKDKKLIDKKVLLIVEMDLRSKI